MDDETTVGRGYALAQLAQAFETARGHADPVVRAKAEGRVERWIAVLKGMASGKLAVGSRTPVAGLPAWVTPEVVRGGFATGEPAAAGPLEPWEVPGREAAFAHALTEAGIGELDVRLTSGAYAVGLPEEAALLTVAWLVGAGELAAAVALIEELAPFAGRLRFLPRPGAADRRATPAIVWRQTAGETAATLERRKPNPRVEAMREALTVWNPFADALLEHWLETMVDGRVGVSAPDGWRERGRVLLDRYDALARAHTNATKHRRPKGNLFILRTALAEAVAGKAPSGLLQHAVDSMVARRGVPGSPEHTALRARQAADASQPAHHALARVVVERLAEYPSERGVSATDALLAPTGDGTPIPPSIRAVVERALAGSPEALIERGIVPSAEVLAELVPPIAAATTALAYGDARLSGLMAANYEAFRRRRSLLLLDLAQQVRVDELPWVRAVAAFKTESTEAEATAAFKRLAELALDAFPATILPSALLSELGVLSREAGLDLPLTEELAADIFMGRFSAKFLRAAQLAGDLLTGTLYARYYRIDYAAVRALGRVEGFTALCRSRAGEPSDEYSVAANGTVIEQAQILTTHNLAALVSVGVTVDYVAAAGRCLERMLVLEKRLDGNPRALRMVKDIAYAWRQLLFFLSLTDDASQAAFLADARSQVAGTRLARVLTLEQPFLGWTVERHPFLNQD